MNNINVGTVILYVGPEEGDLRKNDKLLVLMSRHTDSRRILVQVLTGKLAGHIVYLSPRDVSIDTNIDTNIEVKQCCTVM